MACHLFEPSGSHIRNNMMGVADKTLLRKHSPIETFNDGPKNACQVEHSRHTSLINFVASLVSGLLAYCFLPKNRP